MNAHGYISDQPWQHTYQCSFSPQNIRLALAMAGYEMPPIRNAHELAFGQGLSLCIHAACNPDIQWYGTDFNQTHVASAEALSEAASINNLTLSSQSIESFCARDDLPRPDLVALGGTWSWLPQSVQTQVASYLSKTLTPNGLFNFDYSTLPGMSGLVGLSRILRVLAKEADGDSQSIVDSVPAALRQGLAFMDTNPAFVGAYWQMRSITEDLQQQSPAAVAHEYFNYSLTPTYFADLAGVLKRADLEWLAPSKPATGLDDLHLTARQKEFLGGITDLYRRQQLRDFTLDIAHRSEIWSRNSSPERTSRSEIFRAMRFILVQPISQFESEVTGELGNIKLAENTYLPLLNALDLLRPVSVAEIFADLAESVSPEEICDALAILADKRMVQVVADNNSGSRRMSQDLNATIIQRAVDSDDIDHLGSPVTGTGVKVTRLRQVFLLAHLQDGVADHVGLVAFARANLKPSENKTLPAEYTDAVLLERNAKDFMHTWLPIYQALGIA